MSAEVKHLAVSQPQQTGLSIQSWDDLLRISDFLAKSALLPKDLRGKPADVAIILMKGKELGLESMQAIESIDVIQGKPALKPEAQLALIYQRFPNAMIQIETDDAKKVVTVAMARTQDAKVAFKTTWTMERARQMQLANKDNWIKQPLTMLKWRAVGEAARTVFPDVSRGLYNSEEAEDLAANENNGTDKGAEIDALLKTEDGTEVLAAEGKTDEIPKTQTQASLEAVAEAAEILGAPVQAAEPSSIAPRVSGESPLGEYLIDPGFSASPTPAVRAIAGKTLAQLGKETCQLRAMEIRAIARAKGKELTGKILEAVTRLEQYGETEDAPEPGSFDEF